MKQTDSSSRKQIGKAGEALVRLYLEGMGWQVLVSNFRCRLGEIDIIAEEETPAGNILVFVEVKTRRGIRHGAPIEAVDVRKQQKLRLIASLFLAERDRGGEEPACRFDIAEVRLGPDGLSSVRLQKGGG